MKRNFLLSLLLSLSLGMMVKGQDGTLDLDYGTFGIHHFQEAQDNLRGHVIDTEGRLIMSDFRHIYRYLPDYRSIDTAFGDQGILALEDLIDTDNRLRITHMSSIPSGGIMVVAWEGDIEEVHLICLLSSGALDTTWANRGIRTLAEPIFDGLSERFDGHIIAKVLGSGHVQIAGTHRVISFTGKAIRLLPDGSVDTSYGNQGEAYAPVLNSSSYISPKFIAEDGSVLFFQHIKERFMMLDASGNSVFTAHPDGRSDDAPVLVDYPTDAIILSSGQVVAAGAVWPDGGYVMRYHADGTLDQQFGNGGYYEWNVESIDRLLEQSDGKILAWGEDLTKVVLSRLHTDGTLDTSFGDGGLTSVGLSGLKFMRDMVFTPENNILAFTHNFDVDEDYALKFNNSLGAASVADAASSPLNVYPNPTTDRVWVEVEQPAFYQLYSVQGQLLDQGRLSPDAAMVDLAPYPTGMYQLSVQQGDQRSVARVLRR